MHRRETRQPQPMAAVTRITFARSEVINALKALADTPGNRVPNGATTVELRPSSASDYATLIIRS